MAARGFEIATLARRPDPLLNFKWMCIDGTLPFGHPADYLEAVDLPFNNVKVDSVPVGSGYTMYPLQHEVESTSMSFYEDHNGKTLLWLMGWKSQIKNFSNGAYNLPGKYKRDMTVGLLDTKGNIILSHKLIGIWPTQTSNLSLNYNESGRLVIQQTFSVDDVDLFAGLGPNSMATA